MLLEECVEALEEAGVSVKVNVLDGRPHGYGYMEGWIPDYDEWLKGILYDNPTAREFVEMLPLTVQLWHPAPGFARTFDQPDYIGEAGIRRNHYYRD